MRMPKKLMEQCWMGPGFYGFSKLEDLVILTFLAGDRSEADRNAETMGGFDKIIEIKDVDIEPFETALANYSNIFQKYQKEHKNDR